MFQYTREILEELPDVQPAPGFYLAVSKKISASHDRRLRARLRQIFQFFPSPLAMTACLVIGLLAGAALIASMLIGGITGAFLSRHISRIKPSEVLRNE